MALVAYGSSGESDFSDDEEVSVDKQERTKITTAVETNEPSQTSKDKPSIASVDESKGGDDDELPISDDELPITEPGPSLGLNLPAPKHTATNGTEETVAAATNESNLLAGLPKPKAVAKVVDEKEDELEDFVKKKETPVEKPPGKKKLPVRITIPSLSQNDSDEEDNVPAKKRAKFSSGSSLFAMLPAPQHAPIKEINRSLVPHSLTKKPAKPLTPIPKSSPSKPAFPKPSKTTPHLAGVPEGDSDEEEETGGNFFSLGGDSSSSAGARVGVGASGGGSYMSRLAAATSMQLPPPTAAAREISPPQPRTEPTHALASSQSAAAATAATATASGDYVAPSDAPLSFKPRSGYEQQHRQWGGAAGGPGGVSASQMYNLAHMEQQQEEEQAAGTSTANQSNPLTEDEQLLRLAGKRHFKREDLHFIDVHQEDQIDRAEMLKNISTEDAPMATHNPKDIPGGQTKRKHQITYLGQMAKARELDLKNQWSQNKTSRRQSAMKYGF